MRWIEMAQTNEVTVKGTAETAPFITAVIKDEIPYMQLSCRDEILRIHYNFKKNDVVKVDFDKRKVFINGRLQMKTVDLLYADFFMLQPGYNEIKTVPTMQLEVEYTERWL
ncbi:phage distal tail protein [Virgibacillus pantothenticus]|uniref:phage distal tail protein n=1 Tax=Virgibacillus pantothenticus TaxID=1473 RepID=UPI000985C55C|nr:phage tail domain-containing protein [Virgibacillus pantothenticus]